MKKLSERLRELAAINRDWNKSVFEAFTDAAEMAQEHEAATGWRPIAEAPKNDEHYLCCDGEHYGWYEAHQEDWSDSGWVSSTTYAAVNPTHFLAVTTPPETKS